MRCSTTAAASQSCGSTASPAICRSCLRTIEDGSQLPLLSDLLKAHEYLRGKGMAFDLVVLNAHAATLSAWICRTPSSRWSRAARSRPGSIGPAASFCAATDLMPAEDDPAAACDRSRGHGGSRGRARTAVGSAGSGYSRLPDDIRASKASQEGTSSSNLAAPAGLEEFNGIGGFAGDGKEYVIRVHGNRGVIPPAPWVNVVAHPTFGFAASDLSTGFTWSENSHDNRLTPWRNDPVGDPPGEAIYLRDEQTGRFWSATPLPAGGGQPYTVRHGHGYSAYEHTSRRHRFALLVYVAAAEPVKVYQIASAQLLEPAPADLGHALRRLGPRREPGKDGTEYRHAPRAGDWRAARRECVSRSLRGSRRLPRSLRRRQPDGHRRSHGVHRPQRHVARAGGAQPGIAVRSDGRHARSVRRGPAACDPRRRSGTDDHRTPRRGHRRSQRVVARPRAAAHRKASRRHSPTCRASGGRSSALCR